MNLSSWIKIRGAREHNLKNINIDIPRDSLIVITGLSGSGKSSLAFDTIYAEGQRRYVESLSAYARQFLGQLDKPDVDSIEGLSPAISIEQKTTHKNPRSTVGTVTEIYDYLRILFAKIGTPFCPKCDSPLLPQTIDDIVEKTLNLRNNDDLWIMVSAPLVRDRKGEYKELFERLRSEGFARVMVDGDLIHLEENIELIKNKKHTIDLIIDRLILKGKNEDIRSRLAGSLELALTKSDGFVKIFHHHKGEEKLSSVNFSTRLACTKCDVKLDFPDISHRFFSFNSPEGACPDCSGLGTHLEFHPDLLIENKSSPILEGLKKGIGWSEGSYLFHKTISNLANELNFSIESSWEDLSEKTFDKIFYGDNLIKLEYDDININPGFTVKRPYQGIIPALYRRYQTTNSESIKNKMEQCMMQMSCPICHGARLKKEALSFKIKKKNIFEVTEFSIKVAKEFFADIQLSKNEQIIADQILKEISDRLHFLDSVGVGYLTLDRMAGTLSGGEAQRIRLATQIGSALTGVLYVLDEPSIGLHQSDNIRLIETLKRLCNLGNTVVVVEHDEETIENANFIVDMGPGAGVNGGNVTFSGTYSEILKDKDSVTGQYLSGKKVIPIPAKRRLGNGTSIKLEKASANNLKNITVEFPLKKFICVTGLSGSGKSTLVNETLYKVISRKLTRSQSVPGKYASITGLENIDKVIDINQSPIGRTPRSNPATYTGAFTPIRELFAQLPASQIRGYKQGRFSFNVEGGRCQACEGDGLKKIEMHFLADVYVTCEICKGQRYNRETLEVRYKTKNIYDVLQMSIEEGLKFFDAIPSIKNKLQALFDVGLGYVRLGQPATTLSGGEAQRIKLATELARRSTGKTLYILDEPTTGLHFEDIRQLLIILHRFVDQGNTVLVIEHNMDIIKTADHIIDMGPAGGVGGGEILTTGTPEEIVKVKKSLTGSFLKRWLTV